MYRKEVFTIGIDSGHGVLTAGKQTPDGVKEWLLNDPISDAQANYLLNNYERVRVIRTDNNEGQLDESLTYRTNKANAEKVDFLISNHHNAYTGLFSWAWGGTETYYLNYNNPYILVSAELAGLIQKEIVKVYGLRNRGVKRANFHMLREVNAPAVLPEYGYMDSLADKAVIHNPAKQKEVGEAVARVIATYFKLEPKKKSKTLDEIAKEVMAGVWGNNPERKQRLTQAGYNYEAVQKRVEELYYNAVKPAPVKPAPVEPKPAAPATPRVLHTKVLEPKTIEQKPHIVITKDGGADLWAFDVDNWGDVKSVKRFNKGEELEVKAIVTNKLGSEYYITPYSHERGIRNGINKVDAKLIYKEV